MFLVVSWSEAKELFFFSIMFKNQQSISISKVETVFGMKSLMNVLRASDLLEYIYIFIYLFVAVFL